MVMPDNEHRHCLELAEDIHQRLGDGRSVLRSPMLAHAGTGGLYKVFIGPI